MSPLDLLWLFFILSSLQPVLQRRWLEYMRGRAFTSLEKRRQSLGIAHGEVAGITSAKDANLAGDMGRQHRHRSRNRLR